MSENKKSLELKDYRCPKCGKAGQVYHASKENVSLECDDCKIRWSIQQGTCPVCEKMNKYARDGMCVKCYEKLKKKRKSKKMQSR